MSKKQIRGFYIFWIFSGVIWLAAGIRHYFWVEDTTGAIIEFVAAVLSFILAWAYWRGFVNKE